MNLSQIVSSDDVAAEVRAWMGRRQRSTRSAALELGWTETYLGRRLNGSIAFNVTELGALAKLLDVPMQAFFERPTILGVRKQDS
jgi:hypothetical protein